MTEKAQRTNKNKIELSQCPPEIVWAIATVLMKSDKNHGGKYDTGNWKKGSNFTQLLDCMERHFSKMKAGLDNDEEDGLPHSWHLATNVMFYIFNELYHPENDNRETGYLLDPEEFVNALKRVSLYKEGTNYSVSSGTIPCDGNPEFNINKSFKGGME